MPPSTEVSEDEDAFHNALSVYLDAVKMLASEPEEQCRRMGDYNVAWELKDDVQRGKDLIGLGYLDETEESWVNGLCGALEGVNTQVLPSGGGREVNLHAMSLPVWEPARFLAAEVLQRLSRAAERNAKYFGICSNAA